MSEGISIAVIGSINLDIVASVRNFPKPGETITDATVNRFPGGKGANQALAAHRLGAKVYMVGRVGDDPIAKEATQTLRQEGSQRARRRLPIFPRGCATRGGHWVPVVHRSAWPQ